MVEGQFGLGETRKVTFLPEGLMNRNWRIDAANGAYALKLLRDVSAETACRNGLVLTALASAGLPVCAPVATRDGDVLLTIGPRSYLVSPWAEGAHVEGTDLPLHEATDLGALVATIHRALGDAARVPLPLPDARPRAKVTGPDEAIGKADRLLAVIDELAEPGEYDECARELLWERKVLIDKHRSSAPAAGEAAGPFGWTHGDLQHRNVLRCDGRVTAVLDWDRIGVRPLGEEVARTAQVQFGGEHGRLDLERVAAFVAGYRSVTPLSRADLADAVERLWWKRMSDYWIFEFHYDRGDHGPDSLMAVSEELLAWWTDRRDDVEEAFSAGA
ncbi:homoserine kinase type II [Sinosporangium album]|uniref:Homoserine kinase type II n=1 Tax=Sinosporangium album TaxID=504805 RepID=A0A1G8KY55_9ACTN|nr:homoserine kinase type II [Sinosporangium album]